jgi:hypothetical protein
MDRNRERHVVVEHGRGGGAVVRERHGDAARVAHRDPRELAAGERERLVSERRVHAARGAGGVEEHASAAASAEAMRRRPRRRGHRLERRVRPARHGQEPPGIERAPKSGVSILLDRNGPVRGAAHAGLPAAVARMKREAAHGGRRTALAGRAGRGRICWHGGRSTCV